MASTLTLAVSLFKVGEQLNVAESLCFYLTPLLFSRVEPALRSALVSNAWTQLLVFLPVCVLPALATGHMAYVDVAWPAG